MKVVIGVLLGALSLFSTELTPLAPTPEDASR
jgi:hypothetical protein